MSFNRIAQNLLKQNPESKPEGRSDIMARLDQSGFSIGEIFDDLRSLYDNTEEDSIKRAIMSDMLKVRGLMQSDVTRPEMPAIIINIAGNNVKVNEMLCPQDSA